MKGPGCKPGVKATMVRIHPPPQHRTQASVPERTKGPACKAGCQGFESLRWLQTCQREHRRPGRDRFNRDMFRGGCSSDRKSAGLWSRRARVQIPSATPTRCTYPTTSHKPRPTPPHDRRPPQHDAPVAQSGQSTTLRRLGPQVRILPGAPPHQQRTRQPVRSPTPAAAWPDTDGGPPKRSGRHPFQESRHLEGLHSDTAEVPEPEPATEPGRSGRAAQVSGQSPPWN